MICRALDLDKFYHALERLHSALKRLLEQIQLLPEFTALAVPQAEKQSWYHLLVRKLLPQLGKKTFLVVAVVGGTNTGKSLIFNCLAGEDASAVSPEAAGTRHPVCLVPNSWADAELLRQWFEGFELREWRSPQDTLDPCPEDLLLWRRGAHLPDRLMVLDTPDVDSTAEVNWHRAEQIREVADVLVGILTQQKYNDAAVRRFFCEAARTDKPVIILFNQSDLEEDEPYYGRWLETFKDSTGITPEAVFAVPRDRELARQLKLPFLPVDLKSGKLAAGGEFTVGNPASEGGLREYLAQMDYERLKLRSLRGALKAILDPQSGIPQWLHQVEEGANEIHRALDLLLGEKTMNFQWPPLPTPAIQEQIRAWLETKYWPVTRAVKACYDWAARQLRTAVGATVGRLYRGMKHRLAEEAEAAAAGEKLLDLAAAYAQQEWEAIRGTLARLFDHLELICNARHPVLAPYLQKVIAGDSRKWLIDTIKERYAKIDEAMGDYRQVVTAKLDTWMEENPKFFSFVRNFNNLIHLVRPAVSVAILGLSWGTAGAWVGAAGSFVQHLGTAATSQLISEAVGEVAVTVAMGAAGETIVGTVGDPHAIGLFRRLLQEIHQEFTQRRIAWLKAQLFELCHAPIVESLQRAMRITEEDSFKHAREILEYLAAEVGE